MFYTLKHTHLADEAYSFETTAPPFSKMRKGRLARVACTNCRIRKLKCSGEPHSCQRCLAKKIECQYPSPPKSNSQWKAPSPLETPQGRSPPVVIEATADDDFITVASNQETTYSSSLQDLGFGFEVSDFTTPENTSTLLSDGEYIDHSDAMRPVQQQPFAFAANTSKTPWNDISELEDIDFSAGNKTSSTASSLAATESSCPCFTQAVGTHEAIEVAVWAQRELSTDSNDILQHQKRALVECEELLECRKCSRQPAYIMLLVSMCSKILGTLEDICHGAPGGSEKATNAEQGSKEMKRKKNGSDSAHGDESCRRGYGISIQKRQLDDDDEHLVLQTLLMARVARLGRLLSMLDKVVSEHSWPAHNGLIRELQNRLMGGSFIVEKLCRARTG